MLKSIPVIVATALIAAAPAFAQTAPAPAATAPAAEAAVPTGAPTADTVVATVNGEGITLGEMIAMKENLHEGSAAGLPDTALWDLMLDQMISQAAVGQVAEKSLTERDKAMMMLDRRAYLSGATLQRVAGAEPTEAELKAAYEKAFGSATAPKTEFNAAHILVATEDEAKAIEDELGKGADFAKLAEEKSTDNSSANKGDLGWFTSDMMVKPFADAVEGLKKGEVSAPVQSQFGWHVIKLIDSRTQKAPEFDAVREQLAMQVRREKVEGEIAAQTSAATIVKTPGLDPALVNKTELLDK